MATFPSVFFQFNSGSQGWTERYWHNPGTTLPLVAAAATGLLFARVVMLGVGAYIVNAFASYDDEFRDVAPIGIPNPPAAGKAYNAAITAGAAQPNDTFELRAFSGVRAGKIIYLSGLPTTAFLYPPLRPIGDIPKNIQDPVNAFMATLVDSPWGWKGVSYDPIVSPTQDIVSMVSAGSTWALTVGNVTGFAKGKKAKVFDARFNGPGTPRGNRVYVIKDINTDTKVLTLDMGDNDFSGIAWVGLGKIQVQNPAFFNITKVVEDKIGTHKRGVGTSRPLGRRKVR